MYSVLVQTEQAEDHENSVEEVPDDGQPHVAEEVEDLSLKGGDELQDQEDRLAGPRHVVGLHHGDASAVQVTNNCTVVTQSPHSILVDFL